MDLDFTSSETTTLSDFLRKSQGSRSSITAQLGQILLNISLASKIISREVNRASLDAMTGLTGETNVQGESVQKLDTYSHQVFSNILGRTGEIFSMVSEEQETLFAAQNLGERSNYVVAFDPLDGSSNIDVNVSIGSIWGVYARVSQGKTVNPQEKLDFLQKGKNQLAAGYTMYGASTLFVCSLGSGVHGFALDSQLGEFILTHPNMQIPKHGGIYSCNEGNFHAWSKGIRAYIEHVKKSGPEVPKTGKPYSSRYVGSLVADFHRTLLKGGIYLYPADEKNKNGKLRYLYECAPIGFLAEQAGGKASTGSGALLEVIPSDIHARSPLIVGSTNMVEEVEGLVRELG